MDWMMIVKGHTRERLQNRGVEYFLGYTPDIEGCKYRVLPVDLMDIMTDVTHYVECSPPEDE